MELTIDQEDENIYDRYDVITSGEGVAHEAVFR